MNRPPHIDPRWWAAASWSARQKAERAHRASLRERARIDQLRAVVEEAAAEHDRAYGPAVPERRLAAAYAEAYGHTPLSEGREHRPLPQRWPERVPIVEEMLGLGRTPEEIAAAFGIQLPPVEKGLMRAGRPDLAKPFRRAMHQQERHPCADCPTLVRRQSTRCRPCASAKPRSGRGEVAA